MKAAPLGWAALLLCFVACAARSQGAVDKGPGRWTYSIPRAPDPRALVALDDRFVETCGIDGHGDLVCWRDGGEFASGLHGERPFIAFTVSNGVGCVIDETRAVFCWEDALANGPEFGGHPYQLDGFGQRGMIPVQLDRSGRRVCAALESGRVACKGAFMACGQTDRRTTLQTAIVPRIRHVVQVATGNGFTCSLHRNGDLRCWGDFFAAGPAGAAPKTRCVEPRQARPLLTGISRISADSEVICALDSHGAVFCWGDEFEAKTLSPCRLPLPGPASDVDVVASSGVWVTLADGRVLRGLPGWFCEDAWELEEVPAKRRPIPSSQAALKIVEERR